MGGNIGRRVYEGRELFCSASCSFLPPPQFAYFSPLTVKKLQGEQLRCSCSHYICLKLASMRFTSVIFQSVSNKLCAFRKQDSHYFLCCMWITWYLNSPCSLSLNKNIPGPDSSAWLYIFLNHIGNYSSSEHFLFLLYLIYINELTYPEEDLESYAKTCRVILQPFFPQEATPKIF